MKISINKLYSGLFLLLILILSASCSDWNDIEAVDIDLSMPRIKIPNFGHVIWSRYASTNKSAHII